MSIIFASWSRNASAAVVIPPPKNKSKKKVPKSWKMDPCTHLIWLCQACT